MQRIFSTLNQFIAKIHKASFLAVEIVKSNLSFNPRIKILFSKKTDLKPQLIKGFRFSRHEIAFKELTAENIQNYDLVVPLTIHDLKRLTGLHDLITNNPIPITSIESIELCDNKHLFNQTLIKNGFADYVPKMAKNLAYPYIIKKKVDEWGVNTHIISSKQDELNASDIINSPEYFCQQIIPGQSEYATHILFKNGEIVCSISIEHIFEDILFVHGKNECIYNQICACPYLPLFASILSAISFEGLCCIDYKVVDNRPQVLEINPRFGGSLSLYFISFINHLSPV